MPIKLLNMGQAHEIEIRSRLPNLVCSVDGREVSIAEAQALSRDCSFITVDGQHYQVWRALDGDMVWVHIAGRVLTIELANPSANANLSDETENDICADMPGLVVELHSSVGATIAAGDPLVTIESMKMQIVLNAPRAGVIDQIHHQPNTTFDKGAVLVSLKPSSVQS